MEYRWGKRIKVVNRMFKDAEYGFSMLKYYHGEMIGLLRIRAEDFLQYTAELEDDHKKRQRPFDKNHWLKRYDVYSELYPRFFNNSFIITACALFEFQIQKICALVKEEHKVPLEWDDIKGNVPAKAKSFLLYGGILLKDSPKDSFVDLLMVNMSGAKRGISVKELWQELNNYFRVRNCIAHHNGLIQRMRYPEKITRYASRKGIMANNNGQTELCLTHDFNKEVCDTMMEFFSKVSSAYYSVPLPE